VLALEALAGATLTQVAPEHIIPVVVGGTLAVTNVVRAGLRIWNGPVSKEQAESKPTTQQICTQAAKGALELGASVALARAEPGNIALYLLFQAAALTSIVQGGFMVWKTYMNIEDKPSSPAP
jgi:hypothetical protein